jgi:cellulase/cellobiase CelA1
VTWTPPNGQTISQAWNAALTTTGAAVTARNLSYNGSLGPNTSTQFGFLAAGDPSTPTLACTTS